MSNEFENLSNQILKSIRRILVSFKEEEEWDHL